MEDGLRREYSKIKELHPEKDENDILQIIFESPPPLQENIYIINESINMRKR